MGRILDAMERAREEREQKGRGAGDDGSQSLSTTIAPPPAESERVVAREPQRSASRPPQISHQVVGAHDYQSPIAEQVRQIRTNLETVLGEYHSRPIVITSPVTGDGKTMVTANLTTILADNPAHEVLIVDADMRKPDQHRLFNVHPTPGLSEYLSGECSLEEVTQATALPNLKIMSAGRPPDKPTVLLSSDRMVTLLGELQRIYHWIVFDTPPLLPVTDASVLARECVGVILVVRMGQTQSKIIERAQDLLAEMRLPVLGAILNDFTSQARINDYYYGYYRRSGNAARK
jgi:capsular exopolysaccharide synthesis family protein